jgi:hypothetical protein
MTEVACINFTDVPDLVQQGISEKVALVVNFLAAFVTGFIVACPSRFSNLEL